MKRSIYTVKNTENKINLIILLIDKQRSKYRYLNCYLIGLWNLIYCILTSDIFIETTARSYISCFMWWDGQKLSCSWPVALLWNVCNEAARISSLQVQNSTSSPISELGIGRAAWIQRTMNAYTRSKRVNAGHSISDIRIY